MIGLVFCLRGAYSRILYTHPPSSCCCLYFAQQQQLKGVEVERLNRKSPRTPVDYSSSFARARERYVQRNTAILSTMAGDTDEACRRYFATKRKTAWQPVCCVLCDMDRRRRSRHDMLLLHCYCMASGVHGLALSRLTRLNSPEFSEKHLHDSPQLRNNGGKGQLICVGDTRALSSGASPSGGASWASPQFVFT